jgi:hypothetical protein
VRPDVEKVDAFQWGSPNTQTEASSFYRSTEPLRLGREGAKLHFFHCCRPNEAGEGGEGGDDIVSSRTARFLRKRTCSRPPA